MKKIEVNVREDIVSKLEGLSYEIEAMKGIIKAVITDNPNNPLILDSPLFKEYSRRYENKNKEYELLKTEMYTTFIPKEDLDTGNIIEWRLDYATCILTYLVKEKEDIECAMCKK